MVFGPSASGPKSSTNLVGRGGGGWALAEGTPETLHTSAKIVYILYVFEWFLCLEQVVQNSALIWGGRGLGGL